MRASRCHIPAGRRPDKPGRGRKVRKRWQGLTQEGGGSTPPLRGAAALVCETSRSRTRLTWSSEISVLGKDTRGDVSRRRKTGFQREKIWIKTENIKSRKRAAASRRIFRSLRMTKTQQHPRGEQQRSRVGGTMPPSLHLPEGWRAFLSLHHTRLERDRHGKGQRSALNLPPASCKAHGQTHTHTHIFGSRNRTTVCERQDELV